MPDTRVVRGKILGADVTQKEGSRVQFQIDQLTAADTSVRVQSSIDAETDANGDITVELPANQSYTAKFPNGEEAQFFLPDGDGEANLAQLLTGIAKSLSEQYRFESFVKAQLPALIKPILDDAAQNVARGAAGTSILSAPRPPQSADGNNGDTFLNTLNGDLYVKTSGSWGQSIGRLEGPPRPGTPGTNAYVHIAYAESDTGDGFSQTPSDYSSHISFYQSDDPAYPPQEAFTNWLETQGIPGTNAYVHIAYAESDTGDGFSQTPSDYSSHISFYQSDDPAYPPQEAFTNWLETQGIPGQDAEGQDGLSSYIFVRYAEDADGSGITETPESVSTHFAILTKNDPESPTLAELSGLWIPYTAGTGPGTGSYAPPPPLHVKLSEVTNGQFNISMKSNRAYIVVRDAPTAVVLQDRDDAGRADVTFVNPASGVVHPVNIAPAGLDLTFTDRRGYADNYLFKSFQDKIYARPSLLDFPYQLPTGYWVPDAAICYLFELADRPLANRVADHSHLTTNDGDVRTPYGIDLTTPQYAYTREWAFDFNQPFMVHLVVKDLSATAPGEGLFGFHDKNENINFIGIVKSNDVSNGHRLYVKVRNTAFNESLGTGSETVYTYLPSDLSGMTSLLFSRNSSGRYQLRCLDNGAILKPGGAEGNSDGYYPAGVSSNVFTYPTLGASLGGTKRSGSTSIYDGACKARYLMAEQVGYSAAEAKATHNIASNYIAAIHPTGTQLAKI